MCSIVWIDAVTCYKCPRPPAVSASHKRVFSCDIWPNITGTFQYDAYAHARTGCFINGDSGVKRLKHWWMRIIATRFLGDQPQFSQVVIGVTTWLSGNVCTLQLAMLRTSRKLMNSLKRQKQSRRLSLPRKRPSRRPELNHHHKLLQRNSQTPKFLNAL